MLAEKKNLAGAEAALRQAIRLVEGAFAADPKLAADRAFVSRLFAPFAIAAWIVPLLARGIAGITGIPLGLLVLVVIYIFTLRRAVLDREHVSVAAGCGIAQA